MCIKFCWSLSVWSRTSEIFNAFLHLLGFATTCKKKKKSVGVILEGPRKSLFLHKAFFSEVPTAQKECLGWLCFLNRYSSFGTMFPKLSLSEVSLHPWEFRHLRQFSVLPTPMRATWGPSIAAWSLSFSQTYFFIPNSHSQFLLWNSGGFNYIG